MEFKSDGHKRAYEKTRDFLHTLFGEVNVTAMDDLFVLQEGSTFVYIRTFPIGDKKSGVEIFSYVVIDIDVTEGLMRYLLTYNLRLMLGAFGLSVNEGARGTVLLTHTLIGDSMDRDGLWACVTAIARVADELDDKIVADFGGKTALDKLTTTPHAPVEYWE